MDMRFYWINDRIKQGQFCVFWRNYLVAMPTTVELSTWMAVGPCVQPISYRVVRMGTAVWALMKIVLHSASASDAMILRMILHTTSKMPLVVGPPDPENPEDFVPTTNGILLVVCKIMRNIMASAAKVEYGTIFINAQTAVPIRTTLSEMRWTQVPTAIQVDNSTVVGIATK